LSDLTGGVAEGKTKRSASRLVDDPCEGGAGLPTKVFEGSSTGLTTGEQAQEIRGGSTRPGEEQRLAQNNAGSGCINCEVLSSNKGGEEDGDNDGEQ